jgi:hypothetical protein
MRLLDRGNPLWAQVHALPADERIPVATVIVGYDFCRSKVEDELLTHLKIALGNRRVARHLKLRLVDEAVLGVLRSSVIPRNGRGVIPDHLARSLPDVLGTLACAAANHRAGQFRGNLLEETGYSDDPVLARRQVLAVWGELAGLSPQQLEALDRTGFAEGWDDLTTSLLEGVLTGLSRAGAAMLLAKAEKVARLQPRYLEAVMQGLVGSPAQ